LLDPGHDGRQAHPHEAAESGHRPADSASGGGQLNVASPQQTIAVGIVVERSKSASQWSDFLWRPLRALIGSPATRPWTKMSDDGERGTFLAGTATIELHRTETANFRGNLMNDDPLLWVVLRPSEAEMPYDLLTV